MPDDDTMLAQHTVDFRNEERIAGSGRAPSGVNAPSGATARVAAPPKQATARPDIPALLRELYECRYEHCLPCADRVRAIEAEVRRLGLAAGVQP